MLAAVEPRGRLELTWTNKDMRLLAHEDGSYQWVPPSDYRVAEVRLLDDAAGSSGHATTNSDSSASPRVLRSTRFVSTAAWTVS
jgi:hypothetical protein